MNESSSWVDYIPALVTAAVAVGGVLLNFIVAKSSSAHKMIDQLQEERLRDNACHAQDKEELRGEIQTLRDDMMEMVDYADDLRIHIITKKPPPPPDWPLKFRIRKV